jgi:hypothetical protein
VKFAFAPDGMTGWIATISDIDAFEPLPTWDPVRRYFYPVFFKTEDGGETWSDPIPVRLDGEDGLPGVLDFWTDEQIAEMFNEPLPERTEIPYTLGFDCDVVVDAWGNPHMAVMVGMGHPNGSYSITSEPFFFGAFDIFSTDGGDTWDGFACGNSKHFRYEFGDPAAGEYEDTRVSASRTQDGGMVFISWLDTRITGSSDNSSPDIFCRGIDVNMPPEPWYYTVTEEGYDSATNVTAFSEAQWNSYWFNASNIALETDTGYTIPFTYMFNGPPFTLDNPVQFKYVQNFTFNEGDFLITGIDDKEISNITSVSQNYPNPFNQTSTVRVNIAEKANLSMTVTNILGQQIMQIERGVVPAGMHEFVINGSQLENGIYFYTVKAGNESVTRKMMIE